jgi:hypothetical protein
MDESVRRRPGNYSHKNEGEETRKVLSGAPLELMEPRKTRVPPSPSTIIKHLTQSSNDAPPKAPISTTAHLSFSAFNSSSVKEAINESTTGLTASAAPAAAGKEEETRFNSSTARYRENARGSQMALALSSTAEEAAKLEGRTASKIGAESRGRIASAGSSTKDAFGKSHVGPKLTHRPSYAAPTASSKRK